MTIFFKAKATLGFSPSTAVEDMTQDKMHMKFTQKLQNVRISIIIHEVA